VAAALVMARLLDRVPSRERKLCLAMICRRVISPASKPDTVRALEQSTFAEEVGVLGVDEDGLYAAMDWLLERQARIEDRASRSEALHDEVSLNQFLATMDWAFQQSDASDQRSSALPESEEHRRATHRAGPLLLAPMGLVTRRRAPLRPCSAMTAASLCDGRSQPSSCTAADRAKQQCRLRAKVLMLARDRDHPRPEILKQLRR
jgi:hypothetical protein